MGLCIICMWRICSASMTIVIPVSRLKLSDSPYKIFELKVNLKEDDDAVDGTHNKQRLGIGDCRSLLKQRENEMKNKISKNIS